jgi:uncharacterized membrane protein
MKQHRVWQNLVPLFKINPYRRHFNSQNKALLSESVRQAELGHRGEIRLVIESQMAITLVRRQQTARQRALTWFSDLRVWDTEGNTGILLYLLLSEKKIEIVADRGIAGKVPQLQWDGICEQLRTQLAAEQVVDGLSKAVQEFGSLLRQHFPITDPDDNPDELSNELVFIS